MDFLTSIQVQTMAYFWGLFGLTIITFIYGKNKLKIHSLGRSHLYDIAILLNHDDISL